MKIFELRNNQPIVTTEGIVTFRELYDRDTSEKKDRFFQEMCYIYFLYDFKSYYLAYSPEVREKEIIKDYIKIPDWKPDDVVKRAVKKYKELINTFALRYLDGAREVTEKTMEYWKNVDYKVMTVKGEPKYKINDVNKSVADAAKVLESLDKLTDRVQKEQALNSKSRGEGSGGEMEFED